MTKNSAIDYNYVHGNIGTAIWADTDNAGLDISGNYITDNWSNAIAYEISYNGNITDNYLAGNDYGDVTTNDSPSFPAGAIFLNGSGDSTAVHSKYNGGTMYISGNVLVNNWGEITLFQDSNRVCGFSADGICTRPFGSPFNLSSCYAHLNGKTQAQAEAQNPNYYVGCVWHMQNVTVSDNSISFDPSKLYTGPFAGTADTCASANSNDDTLCGYMGLFSYYGSIEAYPAATVSLATSNQQNNVFKTNTYVGPLGFSAFNQGDNVGWTQWSKGFVDSYSHDTFNPQDAGSTYTS